MIDVLYSVVVDRAQEVANRAIVCGYAESDAIKEFHGKRMLEEFERLADTLGYDIVKRETK